MVNFERPNLPNIRCTFRTVMSLLVIALCAYCLTKDVSMFKTAWLSMLIIFFLCND